MFKKINKKIQNIYLYLQYLIYQEIKLYFATFISIEIFILVILLRF